MQHFVTTTSQTQLEQTLKDFVVTKAQLNHAPIKYLYIDNCCTDRSFYQEVIPGLCSGLSTPPVARIENEEYVYVSTKDPLQLAIHINYFYQQCRFQNTDTGLPIGLDCEWGRDLEGTNRRHNIGTIQMAIPQGKKITNQRKDIYISHRKHFNT